MKLNYWNIFLILFFIGGMIYSLFIVPIQEADIKKNGLDGICTIISSGTKNIVVSYQVNSKLYDYVRGKPYGGLQIGEKFLIKTKKNNPKEIVIFFDKPVIPTHFLSTSVHYVNPNVFGTDIKIAFKYMVNNVEYKRIQWKPEGFIFDPKKEYIVKYDSLNPSIAYLILP